MRIGIVRFGRRRPRGILIRRLSPELRGQYRKWAHAVLDAHHCACAHDMCPTGLDGIVLQHARLLDRLERSRAHGVAYWNVL